ncbi:MAG: prepilin peptidase, partial [Myxococcota bacterium]
ILHTFAFVWGAIWGSFLNVVIYRLPEGQSLVHPASHCPKCNTPLAWYDNIPILGWLILLGRCRYCKVPIPIRYPTVELTTAILSLAVWIHVSHGRLFAYLEGPPLLEVGMAFFLYFYFVAILIAIAFIDLDRTIIPHELTGLGAVLGLVTAFVMPRSTVLMDIWPMITWTQALLGGVLGGFVIWGVIKGYALVRGIEGMGWGDFTLMAVCGIWLGPQGVIVVLFLASVQGLIAAAGHALLLRVTGRKASDGGFFIEDINAVDAWEGSATSESDDSGAEHISAPLMGEDDDPEEVGFGQLAVPFGPFIALAAVEYLLLGQFILPWILP